ncbi:uncharacterized protein M6B38_360040 [Iris pallida]|uniref:Uncharacterized protein n=1 Tax=Iris pallida TaxID=29817 RepID=A0AAX6GKB5_IRIPA|nr:uncharacterized protein M6B38_198335 [Iris pallida]KAJ6829140.1 uncharacterized protein M6B38_360040 [Iris pallida]
MTTPACTNYTYSVLAGVNAGINMALLGLIVEILASIFQILHYLQLLHPIYMLTKTHLLQVQCLSALTCQLS